MPHPTFTTMTSLFGIVLAVALGGLADASPPVAGGVMCCMGMDPVCVACRCRSGPGRTACAGAGAPSSSGDNDTNTVVTAPGGTPPAPSATDNADTRENTDRTDNVTATAPTPAADRGDTPDAALARVPGARCRPTDTDRARCPTAMCPTPAGWEGTCAVVPSDRMEYTVTPELSCCACDLCLFELVNGAGPCPGDNRTCPVPASTAAPAALTTGNTTTTVGGVTVTTAVPPLNVTTASDAELDAGLANTTTTLGPDTPTAISPTATATEPPPPAAVTSTAPATASMSVLAVWERCTPAAEHDFRCPVARCVAPPVGCRLTPRSRMRFAITPFDGGCCACSTCQYEADDSSFFPCPDDPIAAYNTHCPPVNASVALPESTSSPTMAVVDITPTAPSPTSPFPTAAMAPTAAAATPAPAPTPAVVTSTASAPAANRTSTAVFTTVLRGGVNRTTSAPALTTVLRGGANGRPTYDSSNGTVPGLSTSETGSSSKVIIAVLIAVVLTVAAAATIGVVACQKNPGAKMSHKARPAGHRGFANPTYGGLALNDLAFVPGAPGVQLHATYAGHRNDFKGPAAPKTAFAQCNGRQPISSSTV